MTRQEETLYWFGFARRAGQVLGLQHSTTLLAALVKARGAVVRDGTVPSMAQADGRDSILSIGGANVSACRIRAAMTDIGFPGSLTRVRTLHGVAGGYRLAPEACDAVKRLVEEAA